VSYSILAWKYRGGKQGIDFVDTRTEESEPKNGGNGGPVMLIDVAALIVSAGRGHRFGGEIPKQYLDLDGMSVLAKSASTLLSHPRIGCVRAVIHPDDRSLYEDSTVGLNLLPPVFGGETRQESVRLGLKSLQEFKPKSVLIHDSVRPFIDNDILDGVIDALERNRAAIPAVPVADTLKKGGVIIEGTVERAGLWRAQTPQGFEFNSILDCHQKVAGEELTDDAAVAERSGIQVAIVPGKESNFKITTPEDLDRARGYFQRETGVYRVGTGFDVHRFTAGDHVMLGGVAIPHDFGLAGHSDADAPLHALTDAVLGAVGAGDIGHYFPPTDPKWKNVSSDMFLAHAAKLVADQGGHIVNADVTIICQAPKIAAHRSQMQNRIAEILNLEASQVNVKGTTTEGLGFTGRGEGIAAQASVNVWLPIPDKL